MKNHVLAAIFLFDLLRSELNLSFYLQLQDIRPGTEHFDDKLILRLVN